MAMAEHLPDGTVLDGEFGELLLADGAQRGDQRRAHGRRVSAQRAGRLGRGPLAIDLDHFGGHTGEEVGGQRHLAHAP
jgi:hypothetical protein